MAMACKVCKHSNRNEIEKELAKGTANLRIATKFSDISEANLRNHLKHYRVPLAIENDIRIEFHNMLHRHAVRLEKLLSACDDWLTDPDDETKYTLAPRSEDLKVVYDLTVGDQTFRRTELLKDLLDQVSGNNKDVVRVNIANDKYKVFLDTVGKLHDKLEMLARIGGLYAKDNEQKQPTFNITQQKLELIQIAVEYGTTLRERREAFDFVVESRVKRLNEKGETVSAADFAVEDAELSL